MSDLSSLRDYNTSSTQFCSQVRAQLTHLASLEHDAHATSTSPPPLFCLVPKQNAARQAPLPLNKSQPYCHQYLLCVYLSALHVAPLVVTILSVLTVITYLTLLLSPVRWHLVSNSLLQQRGKIFIAPLFKALYEQ